MSFHFFISMSSDAFLSAAILCSLIYNAYFSSNASLNYLLVDKQTFYQSAFILVLCFLLLFNSKLTCISSNSLFCVDTISLFGKKIIALATFASLFLGQPYVERVRINFFEYYTMILLCVFSFFMLLSSFDFLTIYISLEMASLCLYVLAAIKKGSSYSAEAGLKYFVLGSLASGVILYGCVLIYSACGTTNLNDIFFLFLGMGPNDLKNPAFYAFGCSFIVAGFLFKIGSVPFHVWLPDVYEGSPYSSTLFFVMVTKIAYIIIIIKLLSFSFSIFFIFLQPLLLLSGLLSIFVGSIEALRQNRVKRLLAYSSISHVGFLLLGLSAGNIIGVTSVLHYILVYSVINALLWGCLLLLEKGENKPLYINDLSSLFKYNRALSFSVVCGLFALAGVPPLSGFFMKMFILLGSFSSGLYEISLVILVVSVIGSFYYLRVLKIICFEESPSNDFSKTMPLYLGNLEVYSLIISLATFTTVFFSLFPSFFFTICYKVSLTL